MPRKTAVSTKAPATDPQEQTATTPVEEKQKPQHALGSSKNLWYYSHQYGGITLGAVSCAGTALLYDIQDEWKVFKLVAWLLLALLGLAIHETRPFRRMNYGDIAQS